MRFWPKNINQAKLVNENKANIYYSSIILFKMTNFPNEFFLKHQKCMIMASIIFILMIVIITKK